MDDQVETVYVDEEEYEEEDVPRSIRIRPVKDMWLGQIQDLIHEYDVGDIGLVLNIKSDNGTQRYRLNDQQADRLNRDIERFFSYVTVSSEALEKFETAPEEEEAAAEA